MFILSPQLGISPKATAGGETYDRELLKQLVKLGVEVRILLPKGKLIPKEICKRTVDRTPISHFVPPYTFNIFSLPWALKKVGPWKSKVQPLKKIILRIHSPEYLFPTAYGVKKLRPEVPVVAHYHLDQTGRLWTAMNRQLLNLVDAVIADSEYLKKRLVNRVGVDEKLIHVIHCGVDTEAIRPQKLYKGRKTLLYLGRLIERKRPDMALEVFARLHEKHPQTKLVIVGDGPMQRQLQQQAARAQLQDMVEFTGPLFGKEKLRRYHQADLFIFPSEKEGFVLSVLEAMAAGLPLLVPNSLGFPEAVEDGKNGLLADPTDVDDWVARAERMLFSQRLSTSMGKASREMAVKKFSLRRWAERNLEVYDSC